MGLAAGQPLPGPGNPLRFIRLVHQFTIGTVGMTRIGAVLGDHRAALDEQGKQRALAGEGGEGAGAVPFKQRLHLLAKGRFAKRMTAIIVFQQVPGLVQKAFFEGGWGFPGRRGNCLEQGLGMAGVADAQPGILAQDQDLALQDVLQGTVIQLPDRFS